ncbi:hypothetical protein [Oryza sativa Japonica Group]|uniref:Uncharacterized protein n=1 Tax=Oryza sativa subsp. japonica TaxID=39947 RepID=Q656E3_ORYSJ|nr:hypothetical protein [Oryza sativa Japonica Group]
MQTPSASPVDSTVVTTKWQWIWCSSDDDDDLSNTTILCPHTSGSRRLSTRMCADPPAMMMGGADLAASPPHTNLATSSPPSLADPLATVVWEGNQLARGHGRKRSKCRERMDEAGGVRWCRRRWHGGSVAERAMRKIERSSRSIQS